MPEKQPFDHRRHLLGGENGAGRQQAEQQQKSKTSTHDDETLARILQEEIMEEERRRGGPPRTEGSFNVQQSQNYTARQQSSSSRTADGTDVELLMRLQQQEINALRNTGAQPDAEFVRQMQRAEDDDMAFARRMQEEEIGATVRNSGGYQDSRSSGQQDRSRYQDQLAYARRVQEQAFNKAMGPTQSAGYGSTYGNTNPMYGTPSYGTPSYEAREPYRGSGGTHNPGTSSDSDMEVARRMQQLEQMGMGRMNSFTGGQGQQQQSSAGHNPHEEEDARLARMLAESGQSFRNMGIDQPTSQQQARVVPAPSAAVPRMEEQRSRPDFPTSVSIPAPATNDTAQAAPEPSPPTSTSSAPPVSISVPTASLVPPGEPESERRFRRSTRRQASHSPKRPPRGAAAAAVGADTPPGINVPNFVEPAQDAASRPTKKSAFSGLFGRNKDKKNGGAPPTAIPPAPRLPEIPAPIPDRPTPQARGPLPYSSVGSEELNVPIANRPAQKKKAILPRKNGSLCSVCNQPATSFLVALDKKYHPECFKCAGCYQVIDNSGPFAYMTDEQGQKHPLHRSCYAELYGVKCAVCLQAIPAGADGKVSFVKHPFFDSERMCPRHSKEQGRRCTGCHRFEPQGEPFADLNDSGRCVCYSCCRSVVVDSHEAQPLWDIVVDFFENKLHLPIWRDMRKVPILVVGYEALNDHMMALGATHGGASQIMTRGLCLTEHQSGRRLKLAKMKFNKNSNSFQALDQETRGYTYIQVPDASKTNPDASVTAILCLSGLPRDLTASVLAHEATHAWIKLHPRYDIAYPIPPMVEEGLAQLIAMLFLTEGLAPASENTFGDGGPSDEKLRQYFKFSIETDDHEIYGEGYRRAATAYSNIGIEALLSHVVLYQDFPRT